MRAILGVELHHDDVQAINFTLKILGLLGEVFDLVFAGFDLVNRPDESLLSPAHVGQQREAGSTEDVPCKLV